MRLNTFLPSEPVAPTTRPHANPITSGSCTAFRAQHHTTNLCNAAPFFSQADANLQKAAERAIQPRASDRKPCAERTFCAERRFPVTARRENLLTQTKSETFTMKLRLTALLLLTLSTTLFAFPGAEHWQGKRVAFLGDSITAQTKSNTFTYADFLKEQLALTTAVYAISGHQWIDLLGQIDRMEKAEFNPDALFIFAGTNDYASNIPLGEWFTTSPAEVVRMGAVKTATVRRKLNTDLQTFRGRINAVMLRLRKRYPEAQIILLTPIHRAFFQCSETNIQPDERHPNQLGLFLERYVQVVREASDIWSAPVIDLYAKSGLCPLIEEHGRYFYNPVNDRLHPNPKGHRQLGKLILLNLRTLPADLKD